MSELNRALEHHKAGRLQEAEAMYREILMRDPDQAHAWYLLGMIAHEIGQQQNAIALIECAIERKPDVAAYRHALGEAFTALGEHDRALGAYEQACSRNPRYTEAHISRGITLHRLGRLEDAIDAFRGATAAQADFAAAHYNLGNALHEAGRIEEAIAAYLKAVALAPDDSATHNNLGIALARQLRMEEALAAFTKAIELRPDFAEAHANRAMALLVTGEFAEGWREHSWRLACTEHQGRTAQGRFSQPQWEGGAFPDKTLLVHTEQGLGDTIQFVRYLPQVKAKGGRVVLACQPAVRRLLESVQVIDELLDSPQTLSRDIAVDLHVPLLELPRLFATDLETIPREVPYLRVDMAATAAWRARIGPEAFSVGICWAGRPTHPNDRNRSTTLAAFAPLARVPGVVFYSLQKGKAASQIAHPPSGMTLVDYSADLDDFTDTAALIANLDLVISVDTAPVHLAGALAKPVWTLLPYAPDWRWLLGRDDTPWYPTMRLFRQPRIGDWQAVMEQVALDLQALVREQK